MSLETLHELIAIGLSRRVASILAYSGLTDGEIKSLITRERIDHSPSLLAPKFPKIAGLGAKAMSELRDIQRSGID